MSRARSRIRSRVEWSSRRAAATPLFLASLTTAAMMGRPGRTLRRAGATDLEAASASRARAPTAIAPRWKSVRISSTISCAFMAEKLQDARAGFNGYHGADGGDRDAGLVQGIPARDGAR